MGSLWLARRRASRAISSETPARIAMTRYTKRGGQVWIKIFPDKPITEKPAETRMGSGKGSPEYWVAVVKPGRVMFEIAGVSEEIAREALRLASHKLPIKTRLAHGSDDHVADAAVLALRAAQDTDALDLLGAGIISDLQITFLLNHNGTSLLRFLNDLDHAPALVLGQGADKLPIKTKIVAREAAPAAEEVGE